MTALLPAFIKIGSRTSLHTPTNPTAGQLVIICTWLGAAPKHIVKYVTTYQKLAPEARILLIESDIQIVTSTYNKQREVIKPAVSVVLDTLAECNYRPSLDDDTTAYHDSSHTLVPSSSSPTASRTAPKILLHMFSNGGTNSATQFLIVLHECLGHPLPIVGLLFDSCPAKGTYWKSHNAMVLSLRPRGAASRFFDGIIVHCILIVLYSWIAWGNDNPAALMRRTLLDENMVTDTSRDEDKVKGKACYLFSEADEQVDWMDIKGHADEAKRKGWTIEEVVFEGSGHCAHFSKDAVRYAEAMKGMWLNTGKVEIKEDY